MKVSLTLSLSCPLSCALRGIRTVDDAGEELLAALEAAAAVLDARSASRAVVRAAPVNFPAVESVEVLRVFRAVGTISATARVLGIARSTVRSHLLRAHAEAAATVTTVEVHPVDACDDGSEGVLLLPERGESTG